MIFRQYDLAIYHEEVDNVLNDPYLFPTELKVSCTDEGSASVLITAYPSKTPRPIKRNRHFRRFLLHAGENSELTNLLMSDDTRILNRHDFFTEQGAIVIVDYEVNKEW